MVLKYILPIFRDHIPCKEIDSRRSARIAASQDIIKLLGKGSHPFVHLHHIVRHALIAEICAHRSVFPHSVIGDTSVIQTAVLFSGGHGKGIGIHRFPLGIIAYAVCPGIVIIFLTAQVDDASVFGQITFIEIRQIVPSDFHGNRILGNLAVLYRPHFRNISRKIFAVISVPHIHQASQRTAHGSIVEIEFGSVCPVDIIESVHIGLVHLLIRRPGHALHPVILVPVHKHLTAGDLDYETMRLSLTGGVIGIHKGSLRDLHVHNLRELIQKKLPTVPQLICFHIA